MMSSGIAMEVHYCMGKKSGVDFYATEDSKCGNCGMKEKNDGCCHDEHKFVKLDTDHKNISGDIYLKVPVVAVLPTVNFDHQQFLPSQIIPVPKANAPPDLPKDEICIYKCVFRI